MVQNLKLNFMYLYLTLVVLINSFSDHASTESSVSTPSHPTTDSGFCSQAIECAYNTPTLSYQTMNTPTSPYLDSTFPASSYIGTSTHTLSHLVPSALLGIHGSSDSGPSTSQPPSSQPPSQVTLSQESPHVQHRTNALNSPHSPVLQQHLTTNHDGATVVQNTSPANGFDWSMPVVSDSPNLGRHLSQEAQSSPVLNRQASLGQGCQQSPVLSRQPSLGQPSQSSPVLSRQPSATQPQGSPVLVHHPTVSQLLERSPSLDHHSMHSGYTTPDERHGNLSRQSSSSGYQGPPTPSFPISPASYQEGGLIVIGRGFRQGSPAPGFQPQLPEKRRMSSGDRPNGALSYGSLNGKIMSPVSGGSTTSYFHTLSDFSMFNLPGKGIHYVDYDD